MQMDQIWLFPKNQSIKLQKGLQITQETSLVFERAYFRKSDPIPTGKVGHVSFVFIHDPKHQLRLKDTIVQSLGKINRVLGRPSDVKTSNNTEDFRRSFVLQFFTPFLQLSDLMET